MRMKGTLLGFMTACGLAVGNVSSAAPMSVVEEAAGSGSIIAGAVEVDDTLTVPASLTDEFSYNPIPVQYSGGRRPFESDHAFDGFVGPFSNPIQFKDPRSLTEARGIFLAAWSDPAMALGDTTAQVYALQLRAAVT